MEMAELLKVSANSNTQIHWKCSLGHEYVNSPNNRSLGQGCPFCSGRKVLIGFNDLSTTHPNLAQQAFGWNPSEVTYGVSKRLDWVCREGHVWRAIVNLRSSQNTTCPVCDGRKLLVGFNDLQTTYPGIAAQAHGWNPRELTFGSNTRVEWICELGHVWRANVNSRTPKHLQEDKSSVSTPGRGCPTCAPHGFDPNCQGWLYLITQPNWQMLQIGITNNPEQRLSSHKKLGWDVREIRGPMDGHLTPQWETSILRMLKANGADLSNETIAGKFDGYTEAWSESTFPVKSIKELMLLTEKFEENQLQ
jgi:hypothetical protein